MGNIESGKILQKISQDPEPQEPEADKVIEESVKDFYAKETERFLLEDRKRNLASLLGGEQAALRYTFQNYRVVPSTREVVEYAKSFNPKTESVYLWGWCGSGKDHLAKAMVREHYLNGRSVRILTPRMLVRNLRGKEGSEEETIIKDLSQSDILYFSEIGLGADTQFAIGSMCEIMDRRHDAGLKGLIFTGNLGINALAEYLKDDRLRSRIEGECKLIQLAPLDPKGREIDFRVYKR